mmetsp:Transcript_7327/g.9909  ORF Transcript_7327/g.9909 Transcript_7327/m.9909 type:complete len:326 (-) Transcript_7327:176-1153(-)
MSFCFCSRFASSLDRSSTILITSVWHSFSLLSSSATSALYLFRVSAAFSAINISIFSRIASAPAGAHSAWICSARSWNSWSRTARSASTASFSRRCCRATFFDFFCRSFSSLSLSARMSTSLRNSWMSCTCCSCCCALSSLSSCDSVFSASAFFSFARRSRARNTRSSSWLCLSSSPKAAPLWRCASSASCAFARSSSFCLFSASAAFLASFCSLSSFFFLMVADSSRVEALSSCSCSSWTVMSCAHSAFISALSSRSLCTVVNLLICRLPCASSSPAFSSSRVKTASRLASCISRSSASLLLICASSRVTRSVLVRPSMPAVLN